MPSLLKSKTVTARKAHACQTCSATAIQPGQTYERDTYAYDGRVYDWVQCGPCADIADEIWNWSIQTDEGIGREDYDEWASEFRDDPVHGDDARAYRARIGLGAPPVAIQ
jgi:hypothetical protein